MTLDLTPIKGIPPHILPENIDSVQIVKGGLNNRNILLNGTYLLKQYLPRDEKNDPVRLRYLREKTAFIQLSKVDCLPAFLNSTEEGSELFLARKWVRGKIISLTNLDFITDSLVATLSSLHNQQYTCEADYNYFDVINRYLREYELLSTHQEWDLPDFSSLLAFYDQKKDDLGNSDTKNRLSRIHGDLVFSNIIKFQQKCILIDWEYTTYGDPLIDLAYLITQNSFSPKAENLLIRSYEDFNSLKINPHQLATYKSLMRLMSALWYALQVIRFSNNTLTHSDIDLSRTQFEELAQKVFSQLKI